MSRLEELIAEYCPNGVEYKTLGEIAIDIYRGSGIKRTDVTEEGIPCVRYGEIYTTYGVWFDKCISHTTLDKVPSPKYFEHGDILFVITGESVEDIAKSTAYNRTNRKLRAWPEWNKASIEERQRMLYVLSEEIWKLEECSSDAD